jgi:CheY-like chemotaxis protein
MPAERMPTLDSRRACILVVDDEPLVAAFMADTLELEGYEVETAKNGREALQKIATRSYDAILSDLRMPELDGVGLYRELELQHPRLLLRLAFVSGTTDPPEYASFLERTGAPVLSKPFAIANLHRLVQDLLQVRTGH